MCCRASYSPRSSCSRCSPAWAQRAYGTSGTTSRGALAAVALHALAYGASIDLGFLRDSRYAAEQWLTYNLPPDTTIGINGGHTYLPRVPPSVNTVRVDVTPEGVRADGPLPEYLVFSEAYFRRYLRHDDLRRAFEALVAGEREYVQVAQFRQHRLRALALIPGLSPRILILRRQDAIGRPPLGHAQTARAGAGLSQP